MTNPKGEFLNAGRFFVSGQDWRQTTAVEAVGPFRPIGLNVEVR